MSFELSAVLSVAYDVVMVLSKWRFLYFVIVRSSVPVNSSHLLVVSIRIFQCQSSPIINTLRMVITLHVCFSGVIKMFNFRL